MARGVNDNVAFRDVFHHTAVNAEKLREMIVADINRCIENEPYVHKHPRLEDSRSNLGPDIYEKLKNQYKKPLLYHGALNLKNSLSDCLIWKWTEATGKYIGCAFWSVGAKLLFDESVASFGTSPSLRDAVKIAIGLSQRSRPLDCRITHEHVYPKEALRRLLPDLKEDIGGLFDRLCVSCVVLESEHKKIDRLGSPNEENPWKRYAPAGIKLVDNPEWPPLQRKMIMEAGLLC